MSTVCVADLVAYLDLQMPAGLAESWDNTGLLMGHRDHDVSSVICCLTITPEVVGEAIRRSASLIISHHPLPFRPVSTITDSSYYGGMLWSLASNRIAVFSPHTRFDSAANGINQQLADLLQLESVAPLEVSDEEKLKVAGLGRGRFGQCLSGTTLGQLSQRLKEGLKIDWLKFVPAGKVIDAESPVGRVAVGCGSAGEFVRDAAKLDCQLFVTGEATFHGCLEAQSLGVAMVLTSHYASERFAVETLAQQLASHFTNLEVWASHAEKSPTKLI